MTSEDEIDADDSGLGQIMLDVAEAEARDFEHRRVLSAVRQRLLGNDRPMLIHDRYRVVRRLGGGGMGEVYLCEDEQLSREIAVKFVRGSGSERDQARLWREARTLAALSHPNLVVAFDVGEHEGRTFLAMEYVAGQTLAQWLSTPRPWREVLARFVVAGRGLAAAHRAGIVHRDFKPANVLLGDDGTVKVADFGLALVEGRADLHGDDELLSTSNDSLGLGLSGIGVAGTARYMSLEQLTGLGVDARSDQFGFCLALYEGLWGQPPFADTDLRTRREALARDKPQVPSPSHGLWRAIRRGLARNPAERWQSMDVLLDVLERAPKRRRWITRSSVGLAMGLGLGLVLVEPRDVCGGVKHELDATWGERRRNELEQQFAELEASHVEDSSRRVLEGLDHWAATWLAEREQVCRAQDSRTEERSRLIARDACLDRQRDHVELLVGMLAEPDAATLAEAVIVVDELPDPSSCIDEPLAQIEPPSPTLAARVARVRQEVARARGLRRFGRLEQAHDRARAANAAALEIDYGPLQAEARAELAKAEDEAGSPQRSVELYDEAIDLAEIHHHDRLVAELRIERAELWIFDRDDVEQGRAELHRAEVAWSRIGGADAWARARLAFSRGEIAELSHDRPAARSSYREALALAREVDSPDSSDYLGALARVVDSKDEALALHREAVEFAQEHWGPRHPRTAKPTFELGLALRETGDGERELEIATEIWMEAHRRPHAKLAKAYFILGREALKRGALDEAEAHARAMAAIQDQVLDASDPDRGEPEQLLATIEAVRGNDESALAHARAALASFELAGPDDPSAVSMGQLVVDELLALDRLDEAERELGDMLAAGPTDPDRVRFIHLRLAELAVRRNRLEDADLQLRTVAPLCSDQSFIYELLRALVDLRLGRLDPRGLERVRSAHQRSPFTPDQLAAWFDQLALTPSERGRFALSD